MDSPAPSPPTKPVAVQIPYEVSYDGDLLVLVSETPQASPYLVRSALVPLVLPAHQSISALPEITTVVAVAPSEPFVVMVSSPPVSPAAVDDQLCTCETLWRTGWAATGQHCNVHHLPWAVSGTSRWDTASYDPVSCYFCSFQTMELAYSTQNFLSQSSGQYKVDCRMGLFRTPMLSIKEPLNPTWVGIISDNRPSCCGARQACFKKVCATHIVF